jgi:S-adenosylmethionine hydrolase
VTYEWISLLTDFGGYDGYVAQCRGSIAKVAPDVKIIDITHQVPAQDIRRGAAVLSQTVGQLPPAVHMAVVDPGVGTDRRGIAIETPGGVLVGPDNGLLAWAADALGGLRRAVALTDPDYHLGRSNTFHGRDIFAPVAAHIAAGVDVGAVGPAMDPGALVRLPDPALEIAAGAIRCEVLTVDRYGNLQTSAPLTAIERAGLDRSGELAWTVGETELVVPFGRTYGEVPSGEPIAYIDSASMLSIGVNGASAADRYDATAADPVLIRSAEIGNDGRHHG